LDPFGGGEVVPAGRLREPLHALQRASLFVVTRADDDRRFDAVRARLREHNSSAPIFRTRLAVRRWRDYRSTAALSTLESRRVAAFCGLGNPQSFWNTLDTLNLDVVSRWTFPDHHHYKPVELQRIAHHARVNGADLLVTTEKDSINLPANTVSAIGELDLVWLEIDMTLENEEDFFDALEHVISRPVAKARSTAG
ncbi:MAG: tetraacyldisaccharide 4'-kinase, partial [Acidobacteriaceae bacterium]|nr:tetraacyldisaccharide 4'-kinase [Acidobacteriaceae bacterium]